MLAKDLKVTWSTTVFSVSQQRRLLALLSLSLLSASSGERLKPPSINEASLAQTSSSSSQTISAMRAETAALRSENQALKQHIAMLERSLQDTKSDSTATNHGIGAEQKQQLAASGQSMSNDLHEEVTNSTTKCCSNGHDDACCTQRVCSTDGKTWNVATKPMQPDGAEIKSWKDELCQEQKPRYLKTPAGKGQMRCSKNPQNEVIWKLVCWSPETKVTDFDDTVERIDYEKHCDSNGNGRRFCSKDGAAVDGSGVYRTRKTTKFGATMRGPETYCTESNDGGCYCCGR